MYPLGTSLTRTCTRYHTQCRYFAHEATDDQIRRPYGQPLDHLYDINQKVHSSRQGQLFNIDQSYVPTDVYANLLTLYSEIFGSELCQKPMVPTKHGIYQHNNTTWDRVFVRLRHLALDRLVTAKEMFLGIEAMGLCQKSSSPSSLPLHIILKKDGSLRPCGDYKCLNMQTEPDYNLIPNIANVTSYLHKAKVLSTLDFLNRY
ncbi:uncharacterized protein [Palaemon carinicauda]|uniref:uncharacterized protein n=1 Tax=Palaemon carinicauda TaxID=392227 RepID=UPI0035B67D44